VGKVFASPADYRVWGNTTSSPIRDTRLPSKHGKHLAAKTLTAAATFIILV